MKITLKPKTVKVKWLIEGFPDYFIGDDKKMYCFSKQKSVNMVLNGYTKGYYLNRKFYSLNKLRPLLIKVEV